MSQIKARRYSAQTYQEACEWFVEFRTDEPDEDQRHRFHAWIQESPANVAAYLDVAKSWVHTGSPAIARAYPMQELIDDAVQAETELVVPITGSKFAQQSLPPTLQRKTPLAGRYRKAIGACLAACMVVSALVMWMGREMSTYSTGIGERRSIVLHDGSRVDLNSRTRIRVHYVSNERRVDLLEGQALFSVAKDATRPFVVHGGLAQVKAVGTEFDVYRKPSGTVVTVIEGRVAVIASDAAASDRRHDTALLSIEPKMLSAGEQLTIETDAAPRLETLDVSTAIDWTQGRLVFESTPLKEVVAEFNRYNKRQIVISDATLEQFEIDGVFSSTDTSTLIQFLRRRPDMDITETGNQIVVRAQ